MYAQYVCERAAFEAAYCIINRATVRAIAEVFGVSKSTVHKDLTKVLPEIDPESSQQVREILETNLEERHIRGGQATKRRWENKN